MFCICYIPLDNRPVVYKRMELLAKSCNVKLLIPENDIVMTALDNQPLSKTNLNHGDVDRLKEWFKSLNHEEIDKYIMVSDQFIFGGLVNSRYDLNPQFKEAKKLIDFFLDDKVINGKPVILIDSLMRLASTACYCNYNLNEYNNIREYGIKSRYLLQGKFTIEDVFSKYEMDVNNEKIDYSLNNLTKEMKDHYLDNRKNKFLINNYLVDYANSHDNVYFMLGIDDSNPSITIQTNDINYLRNRLVNGIVFTGIDELPVLAFTRLLKGDNLLSVDIKYYGGMQYIPGDPYDNGTIEECVNYHLKALDVIYKSDSEVVILMLTYNKESNEKDIADICIDAEKLIDLGKKVIIIDGSGFNHLGSLQSVLFKKKIITKLLSYSNWNTIANVIGLGLSQGISRYLYLLMNNDTVEAKEGYLQLILFSYIKDVCYKIYGQRILKKLLNEKFNDNEAFLNFYKYHNEKYIIDTIEKIMNEDTKITIPEIKDIFIKENILNDFQIINIKFPWYRIFEMDFDVLVK